MTWIQTLELDAKLAISDLKSIQWKQDIHTAATKIDNLAIELSAILSGLPEHTAVMLALQAAANTVANVSSAVAAGTVAAPVIVASAVSA